VRDLLSTRAGVDDLPSQRQRKSFRGLGWVDALLSLLGGCHGLRYQYRSCCVVAPECLANLQRVDIEHDDDCEGCDPEDSLGMPLVPARDTFHGIVKPLLAGLAEALRRALRIAVEGEQRLAHLFAADPVDLLDERNAR